LPALGLLRRGIWPRPDMARRDRPLENAPRANALKQGSGLHRRELAEKYRIGSRRCLTDIAPSFHSASMVVDKPAQQVRHLPNILDGRTMMGYLLGKF